MPFPTRLVCAYCQASSEASGGDDPRSPTHCPSCASPLEKPYRPSPSTEETGEASPRPERWPSPDTPTPRSAEDLPGTRIGRFTVGTRLGGGGYGDVFRARDHRLDREVALKVLKPTKLDAKAIERFLREARAAARLEHPFIVGLHDAGQDDGRLWIAYQIVRGRTLSQIRDARSLDMRGAVAIVRDLAEALEHAHRRGITHRDLKPANVIVDDDGRPHLTDFGLARRLDEASELTGEGTVLGTPAYMSPEQAAGRASAADGRSDIYSLGVILYELICGRRPTDVPSDTPLWKLDLKAVPPGPHSVDRAIPRDLDRICMKALALNPADRFADARSMADALHGWLGRDGAETPPRARRAVATAAIVVVAALAVGSLMMAFRAVPISAPGEAISGYTTLKPVAIAEPAEVAREVEFPYVASQGRKKFHVRSCPHVPPNLKENWREYRSIEDAAAAGHGEPCHDCNPLASGLAREGADGGQPSPSTR